MFIGMGRGEGRKDGGKEGGKDEMKGGCVDLLWLLCRGHLILTSHLVPLGNSIWLSLTGWVVAVRFW